MTATEGASAVPATQPQHPRLSLIIDSTSVRPTINIVLFMQKEMLINDTKIRWGDVILRLTEAAHRARQQRMATNLFPTVNKA